LLGCSPLSATNRLSCSKIFVSNPSYLSPAVPRMEIDSEIVTDGPKLPASEASSGSLCCTNNVWLQCALHPGYIRLQTHTHNM
jgi:hypothetical protein